MTPEEIKYQEFRALGYNHIQAREMTFKNFELELRDISYPLQLYGKV